MCVSDSRPTEIVTFHLKNGETPKLVVDFPRERDTSRNKIMDIVRDFDVNSYNNNVNPGNRRGFCVCPARNRSTDTTGPHSVCKPCSRAHFWPCNHRMCVIAERLSSLHGLAHAQQDIGISYAPLHLGAPFLLLQTVHVAKPQSKKIGGNLHPEMTVLGECFNASLTPRRAPRHFLHRMILKLWLCLVFESIPNDK